MRCRSCGSLLQTATSASRYAIAPCGTIPPGIRHCFVTVRSSSVSSSSSSRSCFTQSSRRAPRPPASLALFTALAFDVRRFHIPMVCLFVCGSVCCKRHCCSSRTMPPGPLRPCRLSYVCCRLLSPAAAPSHGCDPRTARARIWGLVCVRVRASLHARLGAC